MTIKNRNLFRITRFILLGLPVLFKFLARFRAPQKRVLIIKTDAIGDYILFRNFIEIAKNSKAFQDRQIDLLGNKLWREIALKYDSNFIRDFFFINPDDLYEAPWLAFKLSWRLFMNNYHTVLQPTYARTFIGDAIAGFTAAKTIIGFEGDTERIDIKYKAKTDKFYSQKLQLPKTICFEFERSKFFFEIVLNLPVSINTPLISVENSVRNGVIVFPGAGVSKHSWAPDKFLALIKLIIDDTAHQIYLAGGAGESKSGDFLMKNLPAERVNNLIGKTSLTQLIELTGRSVLVITNESSAAHIAAAVKTKAICILGGGHFGRFAPYPENMENAPLCLYEKMDCYYCNWNCIYKTTKNEPFPCISVIDVEKVWHAARQFL